MTTTTTSSINWDLSVEHKVSPTIVIHTIVVKTGYYARAERFDGGHRYDDHHGPFLTETEAIQVAFGKCS